MESANLQLPADQLVGSPPNLAAPSCYGFGSTNVLAPWSSSTPTTSFTNIDGIVSNSLTRQKNSSTTSVHDPNNGHRDVLVSSEIHISDLSSSSTTSTTTAASNLVQDLGGFPSSDNQSDYNDQLARIKEEFSEISFPKFMELLNSRPTNGNIDDYYYGNSLFKAGFRDLSCCSSSATVADHHQQHHQHQHHHHHHHHHQNPLLVKTNLPSSSSICHHHINAPEFDHSNGTTATPTDHSSSGFGGLSVQGCREQFSQIYPSVNVSNLTQYSLMGMNLMKPTGLDHNHFASARFYTSNSVHGQPFSHFGVDPIQQQHRLSFSGHNKSISSFNSEMKRQNSLMEPKTSTHNKKSRLESRTSSCPPFKVRKEKLGDRIAALQQLVSPFGKTDTASVLMEAIGYIKFLQNQVETLSVPYMKSSRNKCGKTMQGSQKDHQGGNGDQEPKRDLKSRGLCLVPLSCMSYVTGDGGGGSSIWPPLPNFGTGRITID